MFLRQFLLFDAQSLYRMQQKNKRILMWLHICEVSSEYTIKFTSTCFGNKLKFCTRVFKQNSVYIATFRNLTLIFAEIVFSMTKLLIYEQVVSVKLCWPSPSSLMLKVFSTQTKTQNLCQQLMAFA